MLVVHEWNAVLLIAVCVAAGLWAFFARVRPVGGGALAHLIALAQTLIAAQIGIGLLLLADGRRAGEGMHYGYGVLALAAMVAPWLYGPREPRARLAWFGGASLVAAALAVRAYMTA